MSWLVSSPPKELIGKSQQAIQAGVKAGNSALIQGKTQTEAVALAVASATLVEKVQERIKRPVEASEPALPWHMQCILNKAAVEPSTASEDASEVRIPIRQAYLGKTSLTADPERSLVHADFDSQQRLVLTFDTGEKITTKPINLQETVEQHFTALAPSLYPFIRFDTLLDKPLHQEGMLFYDKQDHSLAYYNEDQEVTVNIGREQLVRVYNNTATTIPDTRLVYVNGANTGWPTVALAIANTRATSQSIIGMATSTIEAGSYGYVCVAGIVNGIDTSGYTAGTLLYLSATVPGGYTSEAPMQPNFEVEIGTVIFPDLHGKVLIQINKHEWHPSLELLHPAATTTLPTVPTVFKPSMVAYNNGFQYDSSTGEILIENSGSYGITIQFNAVPSASNKNVYFYAEEDTGSGWQPKRYSGRRLELVNAQETQLVITADRYFPKGTRMRHVLYAESTVQLKSTDLPGTPAGTVTLPAFRFMMA